MENRITELEMKIAFQEDTINQLDAVVCQQHDKIDKLSKQLSYLLEQAQDTEKADKSSTSLADDIPPHY